MSEPKWTQGEWEVRGPDGTGWEVWARAPWLDEATKIQHLSISPKLYTHEDGTVWVHIEYESWQQFPSPDWRAMQEANAHLIAAAPELYEALEHAADRLSRLARGITNYEVADAIHKACNALEKARGETSGGRAK